MRFRLRLKEFKFIIICLILIITTLTIKLNSSYDLEGVTNFNLEQEWSKCGDFPDDNDIIRENDNWQILESSKRKISIFNAYLDERMEKTVVRVTLLSKNLDLLKDPIHCQFWFEGQENPIVVKATELFLTGRGVWMSSKIHHTYLMTCPFDSFDDIPASVSLTFNRCDEAKNRLKIIDNHPPKNKKQKFGVCTKQLKHTDREFVVHFVEWIHLLRQMGVSKVHLTIVDVHPDLWNILEYFQKLGYVEYQKFQDPKDINSKLFTSQHRFLQMLVNNDCFYRTRNLYEHIVLIDPDEIIMPLKESDLTWEDLWNRLNISREDTDSVSFENVYFPQTGDASWPEIPKYDYMLQHVKRTKLETHSKELQFKSFFQPDNIVVVYNHHAMTCFADEKCKLKKAPIELGQLNHYRKTMKKKFKADVKDRVIWKYKNELINAVEETLNHFNFQPDP